ncbi:hypothetical protein QBC40DRAFT_50212 [Triangularia verruculosa]|uniref:BTB domain-containing protein n=1 Tax=Triangularia verruculosa TaxID=2587418 RepID=A0AAN6XQU7_9PEZI|nr:hypothetical protein QBC40DRAFT_50212 [Triangularia verruculosa]
MRWSNKRSVIGDLEGHEVVRVLVGEEQREFTLHRKLLCDSCSFFKTNIEAIPYSPSPTTTSSSSSSGGGGGEEEDSVLWLPSEAPDMFEIFVLWLYQRRRFHTFMDDVIRTISPDECRAVRTNLVRLHLFAAIIDLPGLQDLAMDALQDMYLRFDWDMSPRFLAFIYGDCDPDHAVRLRKWGVAMLAWTLHGAEKAFLLGNQVEKLFGAFPQLRTDYSLHLEKMQESRADVRLKNPQLRLPANKLRSGERFFGFRQCTFHSHRAMVGEGVCPHAVELQRRPEGRQSATWFGRRESSYHDVGVGGKGDVVGVEDRDGGRMESDGSDDDDIISPVGDLDLNEMSYLDLS